jgi:hypothetical protein
MPSNFYGHLDGKGHKIIELYEKRNGNVGLFNLIDNAEIKNLTLDGFHMEETGTNKAGVLCITMTDSNLENIKISNFYLKAGNAGGVIGADIGYDDYYSATDYSIQQIKISNGTIVSRYGSFGIGVISVYDDISLLVHCASVTDVNTTCTSSIKGGFASLFAYDTSNLEVSNCISKVSGDAGGGFFEAVENYGTLSKILIKSCYANSDVEGSDQVGGFVGDIWNGENATEDIEIIDCYALGNVTATNNSHPEIAGFAGFLVTEGTGYIKITNCYSIGVPTNLGSGGVGGFAGYVYPGSLVTCTSSYWDTQTSGQSSSALGTGKTTTQMKTQSTFVDWDFDTIWKIIEIETYPWLRDKCGCNINRAMSFIQFQRNSMRVRT